MGARGGWTPRMVSAWDKREHRWHHWSVTLLTKFEGCPRVPYYEKILKLPDNTDHTARDRGHEYHDQSEHLVDTGQDIFGPRARGLRELYPAELPDPLVHAEMGLDGKKKDMATRFEHENSALFLADRPVEGYVDLGMLYSDLPRLRDLKLTSDVAKWGKTKQQLGDDVQAGVYAYVEAQWWRQLWGREPQEVEVGHFQVQTDGAVFVRPVVARLTMARIRETVARAERAAVGLLQLESVESDKEIPQGGVATGMCHKFRGCPYIETCFKSPAARLRAYVAAKSRAYPHLALTSTGQILAEERNSSGAGASEPLHAAPRGETDMPMSMRELLEARAKAQAAGGAAPAASTLQPAPAAPPPPPSQPAIECSDASAIDDDARKALPTGGSIQVVTGGYRVLFNTRGEAIGTLPPKKKLQIQDVPEAPPPAPAPAAQQTPAPAPAPAPAAPPPAPSPGSILPPDVPASDPNYQEQPNGKKKKAAAPAPTPPPMATPAAAPLPPPGTGPAPAPSSVAGADLGTPGGGGGLYLYVNCLPIHDLKSCQRLDVYGAAMAAEAAKLLEVADLRLCEQGASKAKGMLAAMVRAHPPGPGVWVAFPGNFDDPLHTVVETLATMAQGYFKGT